MASTAGSTVISDIVPKERVMEGIGFYGLSNTMATAISPGIGAIIWGLISNAVGTAAIFYGAAISVGIAMILYFVLLNIKAGKQK